MRRPSAGRPAVAGCSCRGFAPCSCRFGGAPEPASGMPVSRQPGERDGIPITRGPARFRRPGFAAPEGGASHPRRKDARRQRAPGPHRAPVARSTRVRPSLPARWRRHGGPPGGGDRARALSRQRSAPISTGAAPLTRLQPAVSGFDDQRDDAPSAARPDRPQGRVGGCAGARPAPVLRHCRSPGSSAVGPAASPCNLISPPPPRRCARAGGAPEFATR